MTTVNIHGREFELGEAYASNDNSGQLRRLVGYAIGQIMADVRADAGLVRFVDVASGQAWSTTAEWWSVQAGKRVELHDPQQAEV
jgi:hypothetical protein